MKQRTHDEIIHILASLSCLEAEILSIIPDCPTKSSVVKYGGHVKVKIFGGAIIVIDLHIQQLIADVSYKGNRNKLFVKILNVKKYYGWRPSKILYDGKYHSNRAMEFHLDTTRDPNFIDQLLLMIKNHIITNSKIEQIVKRSQEEIKDKTYNAVKNAVNKLKGKNYP